ncbi:MAG: hypothetical protein HY042_02760, partial [Spirochaetia bacterium]|nr:hypothetical protein [Spirochaetia bacterium]
MTDFRFESPLVILALAPVWAGLLTFIFWTQRRSIQWIDKSISPRFRSAFTIYGPITFYAHAVLLLIAGWTLIAAAAGPYRRGTVEVTRKAPYVIML